MAEAMAHRGIAVTIVDGNEQIARALDPEMGAMLADVLRGLGIQVRTSTRVEAFEVDGDGHVSAVVADGAPIPADLVVLGLGVNPNRAPAAAAGITTGTTGGISTDRRMATSVEGVFAAGDCVETFHRVARRPVNVALGTHANKQGRVVGINTTGGYATFPGVIGTAVTKVCELEVARTGLTEAEAAAAGYAFVTASVESTSRAGYYPGATSMTVKLIAEKRTGLLLGAQIVGREEAAKRIDGLAIAAWNRMTVEEMTALDLSYAPPFAPVWDPVLIAARKATDAVHTTL